MSYIAAKTRPLSAGTIVGSGTVGPDRPSPPGADTIFEIGSVTKVFTAQALARARDADLLDTSDLDVAAAIAREWPTATRCYASTIVGARPENPDTRVVSA